MELSVYLHHELRIVASYACVLKERPVILLDCLVEPSLLGQGLFGVNCSLRRELSFEINCLNLYFDAVFVNWVGFEGLQVLDESLVLSICV